MGNNRGDARHRAAARHEHEDRVANPCIGAERADLVLAGCAILDAIRARSPVSACGSPDRWLREGMLVQMMREDGIWDREARTF